MKKNDIEAIYPLSSTQEGILFHTLYAPDSGVYCEQFGRYASDIADLAAFEEAWQRVLDRHGALRTAFHWEGLEKPLQVVRKDRLRIPFVYKDLSGISRQEQQRELSEFLKDDRKRGFELSKAPLMRLTLLKTGENRYYFNLTYHHLLLDGWSAQIVMKEVFMFYEAIKEKRDLQLDPVRPYREYISWMQGQDLSGAEAYWRRTLGGLSAATPLGVDRTVRAVPAESEQYGKQEISLSPASTSALEAFTRRHRLTLNTLIQGAWSLLLHRYSGASDIVFGVTVSGRPAELSGVDSMVGLFINTLPLRIRLQPDDELVPWLRTVQSKVVELRKYEYSPLVSVQNWSAVPYGSPLFESMLAVETYPVTHYTQKYSLGSPDDEHTFQRTNYPLTVMAIPGPELLIRIMYENRRFDAETIARMLGHFRTVLENIVANPDQRLSGLSILAEAERRQILVEWNDTGKEYPKDRRLHELFEAQAELTPDAIAVVFEDWQLTYRELNSRANQLAHYLKKLGVGSEVLVGICVERSLEMVIGLLGILKAGGAYVPLDPAYPKERLAFMLEDSQVPVVLTQEHLLAALPAHRATVLSLDALREKIADQRTENPVSRIEADSVAYMIYTSGSTGKPKGALISHRGISNRLYWMQEAYTLTERDRVLQKTPFSFDVSVWEFFWPLMTGARLVVAKPGGHQDSAYLVALIRKQKITTVHFVPSMLQIFLEEEEAATCSSLRQVMCSGEALPFDLQKRFFARLNAELHNLYGPTEASVDVTYWACNNEYKRQVVPIGRPIANIQTYILDRDLEPVPVGAAGELFLGGVGLGRGYLNRPDLTGERFIANPHSHQAGSRLYRTGDLARWQPDGSIEYLGRLDHQIKIRGFRVELGEIEAALTEYPAVREAVVAAREDVPGDKRLVAYIVPGQKPMPAAGELRTFLKRKLPEYMVPASFVFLESLPLSPNGKVDRKALPAPEHSRPELEEAYVAPRNQTEERLAEIWAEILGVKQVGIFDNFFALGGHSLLATQVISRLRKTFQVELPFRNLFEEPTVAGLSECIEKLMGTQPGRKLPPLLPTLREGMLPVSFAQQRLWFLDQFQPNSSWYNLPAAVRLTGVLDVEALERGLTDIVRRHESLRTTFAAVNGQPRQVIAPAVNMPLPTVDLSELPEAERETEGLQLVRKEIGRPFDLARGPLFRALLLRMGESDHVLLLVMHHIISDGWSIGVLLREMTALYTAFSSGRPSPLPELPVQYVDFTLWQRQWLQGEVLEQQLSYWKERLSGSLPLLELPTDRPRPRVQTYRGATESFVLPDALSRELKELSRREGATLFMTLLAAFQTLLYRYSGQEDIIVGTPIANRNRVETEGLIGFFVNTLALRSDLSGNPAFAELLGRVKEAALGAFAHQDLPFEMLVEALQPERDTSHSPVFQVMFALQNAPAEMGSLKDVTVTPLNDQGTVAKFDLTLHIEEKSDAISGSFEYNTDLFDAATISRMSEHLQTLLQGIVADPGNRVSDLPVLTGSERRRLLQEWNDTVRDYPKDKCIHELFEDQAEKTPDAVAAVFDDGQLTYRELNRRSNQLARYLRKLGVGPEVLVGICAERSVEMVAGLLGILKAGGAYVPLDPAYPRERLSFMLEDTRCPVILAQQRLVAGLPDHEATLVRLDADWEKISRENEENPASEVKDGHIAYVMYTSGSTGRPKGICVPHRAIKRLVCNTDYVSLEPSDRVAQAANASFDAATFEIWGALVNGATLVGIAKETALSPQEFAAHIRERRISTLFLTTALFNQMAREAPGAFRSVRHLLFGGEAVDAGWVRDVIQNSPPKRLLHVYGPTESTTFTSWHLVTDAAQESATVPIGRPIAATQTYVLDRTLEPVPIGVPGELHIGGDGLARAYLNRPELTAEKFIPDPFSHEPGSRLYKTGDLVRYQPDGALEFLGRIDHQVKIRGFRIELGEIETTLADHPAVKEAAVIAREDTAGDKRLTAYVVFEGEPGPASAELRAFLKERLPDYMVPSAFVFLEMLPLTANGKVDRKALPVPDQNRPEQEESYVAPRIPAEVMLANIWTEILGVKQAGVHDNFFNLGGHSLLATQVVSRMREVFQAEVPLRSFFEAPTIAALAQLVEDVKSREGESQLPVLGRVSREKYSGNVSPDGAIEISEGLMDEIMNSKKIRSKR